MFSKALALVSVTLVGGAIAVVGCSSSSNGTGTGDDTTPDTGTGGQDAKADHVTTGGDAMQTFDTGTGDTSTTGPTCTSQPVAADSGVTSGTLPVLAIMNGDGGVASACSTGDLEAYLAACASATDSQAACDMWGTGGATADQVSCGNCLQGSAAGNGALIGFYANEPNLVQPNTIACILATDPSSTGTACAQSLLNLNFCEALSCNGCDSTNDPDGSGVQTCAMNADSGACASYLTAFESACTDLEPDGAASVCSGANYQSATGFQDAFYAFGAILCGGS